MIDLKNLNIIVTGATGVIGNSILDKLVLAGSKVLATGTNEEKYLVAILMSIRSDIQYNSVASTSCS